MPNREVIPRCFRAKTEGEAAFTILALVSPSGPPKMRRDSIRMSGRCLFPALTHEKSIRKRFVASRKNLDEKFCLLRHQIVSGGLDEANNEGETVTGSSNGRTVSESAQERERQDPGRVHRVYGLYAMLRVEP